MMQGTICAVTGGGSGIGRSIAQALASVGARVAVLDRDEAGAQETVHLMRGAGDDGLAIACDVSDPGSVADACSEVQTALGDAHVLVNNAAIPGSGGLDELPLEDWNRLLSVNLTGYFLCAQAFGRAMRRDGQGSIVHVSSITANIPPLSLGAYGVAKGGITMLSRQLAMEWGSSGVRSNTVQPGMIRTPLTAEAYQRPGLEQARTSAVPTARIGTPEDVARLVVFLAGPDASYINGADFAVDGGLSHNLLGLIPRLT